jgi:hypothetical protein
MNAWFSKVQPIIDAQKTNSNQGNKIILFILD